MLFTPGGTAAAQRLTLLGLAILGLCHWVWFFHGPLTLAFEDWPKERVYLEVLRDSVSTQQIPLHLDRSLQMTDRFLAIPETMLAPHLLLLPWLDNRQFVTLHVCLLFLVGLAGCRLLSRYFGWSPFTFTAFTVAFSFNGFITARLAVGHFMWAGYYLFPWALWVTLRLLDEPRTPRRMVELGWIILAFFLIGSFHLAVWWMLFLGAVTLVRPRLWWPVGGGSP